MSLPELGKRIDALKETVDEILRLVKNQSKEKSSMSESSDLEAVAAKIIKEISDKISDCPCNKEIIEEIRKEKPNKNNDIIPKEPAREPRKDQYDGPKYSWPNYNVGNEELGSSGNPNALEWPFGQKKNNK